MRKQSTDENTQDDNPTFVAYTADIGIVFLFFFSGIDP